jgi:hypothetical protein
MYLKNSIQQLLYQVMEQLITIKCDGVPDHKSVYFATSDSRYQAYNGTNTAFSKNPNSIGTKSYTFKIPVSPAVNAAHEATPLGPIGVSINGVPIYNQYAGPNTPLPMRSILLISTMAILIKVLLIIIM